MNKLLIAIAATFFAIATFFAATAQAGFNVKMGGAPSQFSTVHKAGGSGFRRRGFHHNRFYLARHLAAKRRALAARKARAKAKALAAAKAAAAKEAEVAEATDPENSSISLSDEVAETKTDETKKIAAVAEELGCKKFIPEVGMTVTVSCE
ncbi:MAG: hypothetical protein GY877_03350 [Hyphomicrobium sp.]|nr:hypothetical protein [Hyphomicrobium sp.]